jgi:hypothetical protein
MENDMLDMNDAGPQSGPLIIAVRIMIEPSDDPQHRDQNRLAHVLTPDDRRYAPVMRGEHVEPDPVNAKPRKKPSGGSVAQTATAQAVTPHWKQEPAAVAQAPSAAAPQASSTPTPVEGVLANWGRSS